MKKLWVTLVIVLGLALGGVIVYAFTLAQDKNALNTELASVKSTLASTQAELGTTKNMLDNTKLKLTSTQSDLTSTNQTLTTTKAELAVTKQTLASSQQASTSLSTTLSGTQQKLTVAQDTLKGLGITLYASQECYDAALVDNPQAKNPTWSELMAFLARDKTENHAYILNVYDCSQFSRDVHNNAEAAGIRAAVVQVKLKGELMGHAFDAFLTTDNGLVYVDCTKAPDKIAHAINGKEYRSINATWIAASDVRNDSWWEGLGEYSYIPTSSGAHAVVSSITIYW